MAIVAACVLTAEMVAAATGGRCVAGDAARVFAGASIDTRTIVPGALFVALRGPNFDGQVFLDDAWRRGAAGAVVSQAVTPPASGAAVILVDDTLVALQRLGRHVRAASGARVIAVTGSAGKTTTKEVTADLLETTYRVFRSRGNLNNHIGVPLSLIGLADAPAYAVIEFGMNHAGEIRTLVEMAAPDVRVWTNVGDAHIGAFGTREALASAKAEILEQASAGTLLVANADDPLVMRHASRFAGRRLTFGEGAGADVRAEHVRDLGFDGTHADIATPAGRFRLSVPLAGRGHLSNVLAATAVALDAGVSASAIVARVATLRPLARRGELVALRAGARLVDDSYNASPDAVQHALRSLSATAAGRRIAVIGEMLELGSRARELHEVCGRAAAAVPVDVLVAVGGPEADGLLAGARAGGLAPEHLLRFADSASAAPAVSALLRPGDLVLVKGSRGTRTDLIADRLREQA